MPVDFRQDGEGRRRNECVPFSERPNRTGGVVNFVAGERTDLLGGNLRQRDSVFLSAFSVQ